MLLLHYEVLPGYNLSLLSIACKSQSWHRQPVPSRVHHMVHSKCAKT